MPPMTRSKTRPEANAPPAKKPKKRLVPPQPKKLLMPPAPPLINRPPLKTSAFHHFLDDYRKKNPQKNFVGAGIDANTEWENMTDVEKKKYRDLAANQGRDFASYLDSQDLVDDNKLFDEYIKELKKPR